MQTLMRTYILTALLPAIAFPFLPVHAQAAMPSGYYLSEYGTDDALLKHEGGCFASAVFRSNQCIQGVNPVNSFAIEYRGRLYCHRDRAPIVDKPLKDGYDRNSTLTSISSMKGWVHSGK